MLCTIEQRWHAAPGPPAAGAGSFAAAVRGIACICSLTAAIASAARSRSPAAAVLTSAISYHSPALAIVPADRSGVSALAGLPAEHDPASQAANRTRSAAFALVSIDGHLVRQARDGESHDARANPAPDARFKNSPPRRTPHPA